jgi:hypothetical protein
MDISLRPKGFSGIWIQLSWYLSRAWRKRNSKICGSQILLLASRVILHVRDHIMVELGLSLNVLSFKHTLINGNYSSGQDFVTKQLFLNVKSLVLRTSITRIYPRVPGFMDHWSGSAVKTHASSPSTSGCSAEAKRLSRVVEHLSFSLFTGSSHQSAVDNKFL